MKKLFLIFGVMLLAVSLMAASCSKQADTTSEVDEPIGTVPVVNDRTVAGDNNVAVQNVSVRYTDSGFNPATVTINVGDTVTFTNTSSKDFRPASNPHPIHTALPGFDAKRAIGSGGSYGFSFNRTGTFKYHNDLSPAEGGTIVVK